MKSPVCSNIRKAALLFPENKTFLFTAAVILLIPMLVTIGQYIHTGYFMKSAPLMLFYWPGTDIDISIRVFVWLTTGLMFPVFLYGIGFMLYSRTLGKVILVTIAAFVCATLLRTVLSFLFGWKENPLPDLAGKADSLILSLWHNPFWEEAMFRGVPLLILLGVEKYFTGGRTLTGVLIYIAIPSVLCGLYHIPGHGMIRFYDTLLISSAFSWLALRYTILAPLVMHCVADAMLVMSLGKLPGILPGEIQWISKFGPSFNTLFSFFVLLLLALIPVLFIRYYTRLRTRPA